jgi:hypothetical protein
MLRTRNCVIQTEWRGRALDRSSAEVSLRSSNPRLLALTNASSAFQVTASLLRQMALKMFHRPAPPGGALGQSKQIDPAVTAARQGEEI